MGKKAARPNMAQVSKDHESAAGTSGSELGPNSNVFSLKPHRYELRFGTSRREDVSMSNIGWEPVYSAYAWVIGDFCARYVTNNHLPF